MLNYILIILRTYKKSKKNNIIFKKKLLNKNLSRILFVLFRSYLRSKKFRFSLNMEVNCIPFPMKDSSLNNVLKRLSYKWILKDSLHARIIVWTIEASYFRAYQISKSEVSLGTLKTLTSSRTRQLKEFDTYQNICLLYHEATFLYDKYKPRDRNNKYRVSESKACYRSCYIIITQYY